VSDEPQQILQACPACATLLDVTDEAPFSQTYCPSCGQSIRARSQFNNFTLVEILGEGGMGSVFKAVDQNLHRTVALKILKKERSAVAEERERLATEARITASINHPHVVKVFSFGEDHGQFYMAMELVERGSLDDLMGIQARVAEVQVLEVGIQIAQGLEAALERGLIHRDVKPGNILFADAHTAKIVDFGLAAPVSDEPGDGEIWGTPYYIAPEKLNNEPEDFRSDIYSLGGTLFHALAGRPPFEAQTASLVALKHIKSQAVSLQAFAPDVSSETAYVINRTLHKDPGQRYASYAELIEHLQYARNALVEKAGSPRKPRQREIVESTQQRQVAAVISLILLAVALLLGVALFAYRDKLFNSGGSEGQSVSTLSSDDLVQRFADGRREIVAGQYEEALSTLRDLSRVPGIVPPERDWVLLNAGLAALLAGHADEAREFFGKVAAGGPYSGDPDKQLEANFFVNAGTLMSTEKPISSGSRRMYAANTLEAFGLFLFGMKDWTLAAFDDAAPLLQDYVKAPPLDGTYAWINEYRPLAENVLTDYAELGRIRTLVRNASDASSKAAALEALQASRDTLKSGDVVVQAYADLEANLK